MHGFPPTNGGSGGQGPVQHGAARRKKHKPVPLSAQLPPQSATNNFEHNYDEELDYKRPSDDTSDSIPQTEVLGDDDDVDVDMNVVEQYQQQPLQLQSFAGLDPDRMIVSVKRLTSSEYAQKRIILRSASWQWFPGSSTTITLIDAKGRLWKQSYYRGSNKHYINKTLEFFKEFDLHQDDVVAFSVKPGTRQAPQTQLFVEVNTTRALLAVEEYEKSLKKPSKSGSTSRSQQPSHVQQQQQQPPPPPPPLSASPSPSQQPNALPRDRSIIAAKFIAPSETPIKNFVNMPLQGMLSHFSIPKGGKINFTAKDAWGNQHQLIAEHTVTHHFHVKGVGLYFQQRSIKFNDVLAFSKTADDGQIYIEHNTAVARKAAEQQPWNNSKRAPPATTGNTHDIVSKQNKKKRKTQRQESSIVAAQSLDGAGKTRQAKAALGLGLPDNSSSSDSDGDASDGFVDNDTPNIPLPATTTTTAAMMPPPGQRQQPGRSSFLLPAHQHYDNGADVEIPDARVHHHQHQQDQAGAALRVEIAALQRNLGVEKAARQRLEAQVKFLLSENTFLKTTEKRAAELAKELSNLHAHMVAAAGGGVVVPGAAAVGEAQGGDDDDAPATL